MGLFTPIWMTDKKEKVPRAVAAVEKVTDPERLRTMATSANFGDIRIAACARITDQDTLAEIAEAGGSDVACRLLERLSGRDDLLMSVAGHFASGYNAGLLVPLLSMVGDPDSEKLIGLACAIVDHRKRDGKWFRDIEGYDRIMEALGRAACRAHGDRAGTAALIADCAHGWHYELTNARPVRAAFDISAGSYSTVTGELEKALPGDIVRQRIFIDSLGKNGENAIGLPAKILGCCLMIGDLRPFAYDVFRVVDTARLRCDLTGLGSEKGQDPRNQALKEHEKVCAGWKESAKSLISLARERPEIIYPVRGQLEQAVNGAEAQIREKKQAGFKTIYRKAAPDAPEDWLEAVRIPDYRYSTRKISMNLRFPAEEQDRRSDRIP